METKSLKRISFTLRILYPIWMIIGVLALMYIPSLYFVKDNPIETVQNIRSNEHLFRLGILANIITQLFAVFIPILLYRLFESVNRFQAMLMLILNLIAVPIVMYGEVHSLQALSLLDNPELMMEHLKMNQLGLVIAFIFWGLWLFPLGSLAIKSGYFPKLIGYCLYIGGVGYLLGAFITILEPSLDVFYEITEILTIGEVLFILWFVIKGAKLPSIK
jgi:hypothetical protein